jgi:hypothetical protein
MSHTLSDVVLPPADKPAKSWHVSPVIDLLAYHYSWLFILIPLACAGDKHPKDYLGLFAFGMTLSLCHRYYTLPYVFLDKQVFSQHVTRFTLFFYLLNLGGVAGAFFFKWKSPKNFITPVDVALVGAAATLIIQCIVADKRAHRFSVRALVAVALPFTLAVALGLAGAFTDYHEVAAVAVAVLCGAAAVVLAFEDRPRMLLASAPVAAAVAAVVVAALGMGAIVKGEVKGSAILGVVGAGAAAWNIWHTLMQKFGIMRVYAAKSSVPVEKRTPAWADRLLIFGSFPFLALYLGPSQRDTLMHQSRAVTQYIMPLVDGIEIVQPYLLPPAALLSAVSIALFVYFEHRADGLRSWPRLSMAVALTLLNASFLVLSPLKVYIAYGFSHAIEYMVFVWAFLRRRYAQPLAHEPVLQKVLRRPWLAYGLFTVVIAGVYFWGEYGKDFGLRETHLEIFGVRFNQWLFSFAIWQSLAHFYFDGFLWKMRLPQVRASL